MIGNSLLGQSRFSHRGIGGTGLSWLVAGSVKPAPAQKPCESGSRPDTGSSISSPPQQVTPGTSWSRENQDSSIVSHPTNVQITNRQSGSLPFHNGAIAHLFSADEPERLRGPQCEAFWADELAAWRFLRDAWDNLQFGFRLGNDPRGVITTTPKPLPLIKDLIADEHAVVTRASSYENRANLAPTFFDSIIRKYEGTRIGRQELMAEVLEDAPGALWTMQRIDAARIKAGDVQWDAILRVVVAIDPAVTAREDSDETGIIVAALTRTMHVVVLEDLTCKESPAGWARIATTAYYSQRADRIIGEVNNGGDLVEANIRATAPDVAYRSVRASRGKAIRAEPVAALYEQGRVHHVGNFPLLEEQMCSWSPQSGGKSPDRMDALVWAITDLVVDQEEESHSFQIMPPVRISRY